MKRRFSLFAILLSIASSAFAWTMYELSLQQKVENRMLESKGKGYTIRPLNEPAIAKVVPQPVMMVRFPAYPAGVIPPPPYRINNIFYENSDAKLVSFATVEDLKAFFVKAILPALGESAAKDTLRGWLALSGEIHQDGFFSLSLPEESIAVSLDGDRLVVSGKMVPSEKNGDQGEISASLTFDELGKLFTVTDESTLKAGVRPLDSAAVD